MVLPPTISTKSHITEFFGGEGEKGKQCKKGVTSDRRFLDLNNPIKLPFLNIFLCAKKYLFMPPVRRAWYVTGILLFPIPGKVCVVS